MSSKLIKDALRDFTDIVNIQWDANPDIRHTFWKDYSFSFSNFEFVDLEIDNIYDRDYVNLYNRYIFTVVIDELSVKVDYLISEDCEFVPTDFSPHGCYRLEHDEFRDDNRYFSLREIKSTQLSYAVSELLTILLEDEIESLLDMLVKVRRENDVKDDKIFYEKYKDILSGVEEVQFSNYEELTLHLTSGLRIRANKSDILMYAVERDNEKENRIS